MKRVLPVLSPKRGQVQTLLFWAIALFLLPMAVFVAVVLLQPQSRSSLQTLSNVALWLEPLGEVAFDPSYLQGLTRTEVDLMRADWAPVTLPNSIELGASVDLPVNAPKARAWFRLRLPPGLVAGTAKNGRLALMGNRVVGGPWAVWVNGKLVQANLADWRMQWNTPLRVVLPLGTQEILLAVPYVKSKGYAMGSLFVGPVDAIDAAWQARNFWQADAPRAASLTAVLLFVMSIPLALGRRREPVFFLLSLNALVWGVVNLQYFYDFTGQDELSKWFGVVMDLSINWNIVLGLLFAFEFERLQMPRLRAALILYACVTTVLALPMWGDDQYALVSQHYGNVLVFTLGLVVLAWHVWRSPRREGVALLCALLVQLALGVHSLLYVTNQTHPDHVHTFPYSVVANFVVFMYAISRRTVVALNRAEGHQAELEHKLTEQKAELAAQHNLVRQLELEKSLAIQREAMLQDLHDGLGSNLTSALLQARGGQLSPDSTLLLLQDLTDELRHLGKSTATDPRSLNDILAELRERVQGRLKHGGIALQWQVDINLPNVHQTIPIGGQHLRAILSEAIANCIKHAGATQIRVSAELQNGSVEITVSDNGKGLDQTRVENGRGLPGLRHRAAKLGATLQLLSQPGQGTQWRLNLPLAAG